MDGITSAQANLQNLAHVACISVADCVIIMADSKPERPNISERKNVGLEGVST
jgi:20S proteasome alpha/beta subunit